MKNKSKNLIIFVIFLFSFVFVNHDFYYNNGFYKDPKQIYGEIEEFLKNSFTFTYNETFQTLTYRNDSITNSTGWGNNFLNLPHQEIVNLSNFNYNFERINSINPEGNLLFLADNLNGIKLLNISNPANPTLISQYGDTNNHTFNIAVQGKFAYVADGADGLEVIDISNPLFMQKVNSWSNGYNVTDVLISGNLAFLSVQDLGIEIINITQPQSLIEVSNWTNYKKPSNVVLKGNLLFVASENYKLEILDISNFKKILKVAELPISNKIYQILLKDDYIYLANGIEGLKVVEIKDISNPSLISTFNPTGSITNILIEENYAFLANNAYGLSIVDILNPFIPKLAYNWSVNEKINSIKIYGEYIYLGCELSGLQVLRVTELIHPKEIYEFSHNVNARNIILDNDKAYLCSIEDGTYDGGLSIFDISDPFNPQKIGNFSKPGLEVYDVEVKGEICFVAAYNDGFMSLNISDPKNINILDSISGFVLNYSQNVEVVDDIAFVANGLLGLDIYNISDPLNLQHITNYPGDLSDGVYSDVKVRKECAFIAKGYEGLEIINISNIDDIKSIANYTDSYNNSQALDLWGNYLLVADRFDGLEILDISDESNPQKVSQYTDTYNRALNVKVIDNLAIISDRADGIEIINISNPFNLVEVASYSDDYNNTRGCAATSRFLYIADAYDGLQVVQYREHLFNQYKKRSIAQSLEIDTTIATITNATMVINGEFPDNTSIQSFLSNDYGNNWEPIINNSLHSFLSIGSELVWKVIISTNNDLLSPKIFNIMIQYSAINTPPIILNPTELQNLALWNQPEDFGFFEIDLSSYKDDNEFSAEYLYWSIINLNTSLVSAIQDSLNKDIFRFYSIDNLYGNDEFELLLEDEAGASASLNISLTINSINDAPFFIEDKIKIEQLSTLDIINIEYEADDVDNILSELNYSIYYGVMDNWHLIIEEYKDTAYTWETNDVPFGKYYIKIIVSDGLENSTWISPESYWIKHERPLLNPITIAIIVGEGAGLIVIVSLMIRANRRKKEPLPITDNGVQ